MEKIAREIRKDILKASYEAGACHIGSALSCVEILLFIYNFKRKKDYFIFSKASGVATLYAILAHKGIIPKNKIAYYLKKYPLPSKEVPGVIWSGGSLGHGLPVAVGLALADRNRNVYCLMSDGECDEGTTYESALFARQHKLTNIFVFVDFNGLQACGKTEDILDLTTAISFLLKTIPCIFFAQTTKGKGIDFAENNFEWHYKNLTLELYEKAIFQLSK